MASEAKREVKYDIKMSPRFEKIRTRLDAMSP